MRAERSEPQDRASAVGAATFEGMRRGSAAPHWVKQGITVAWGLPEDTDVTLIVLSENVTFLVKPAEHAPFVVRLGRPGYAESTPHIRSELVWVGALRADLGIPTPAPVRGADGDFVQTISGPGHSEWFAVAFEFVSGTMLEDQPDFAAHFTELGRLTASLHAHARTWQPPAGFTRFSWTLEDMVGPHSRWGNWRDAELTGPEVSLLQRAEERAVGVIDDAGVSPGKAQHWGLIHADLRPSNVMTGPGGLAIIDFDDCGYGFFLYDFAASLTFYEHRAEARDFARRWIEGYRQIADLSAQDLEVATAFVMLRRLTMLGWQTTHSEDALPTDLWQENRPGTLDVAERYLENPRWLFDG